MFPEHLQQPGDQGDTGAEERHANDIESTCRTVMIGHVTVAQEQRRQTNRNIDEEYSAPGEPVHDQSAHGWAQERTE